MTDVQKLRRALLDLKATREFLRQYPHLAVKVDAALDKATAHGSTPR